MNDDLLNEAINATENEEIGIDLSQTLLSDFMLHLGATTMVLLIKHLIDSESSPEKKEELKNIPDTILDSWEQTRKKELNEITDYVKILEEKGKGLLTPENIQDVAKKFANADEQKLTEIVTKFRHAFKLMKEQF
jgi:hypothetical protein